MNIETIIQLAYLGLSLASIVVTIGLLIKRKRTTNSKEEQMQIDQMIITYMQDALVNLTNAVKNANLSVSTKQVGIKAQKALKMASKSTKNGLEAKEGKTNEIASN